MKTKIEQKFNFEDLMVYQKALEYVDYVYKNTNSKYYSANGNELFRGTYSPILYSQSPEVALNKGILLSAGDTEPMTFMMPGRSIELEEEETV